MVTATSGRGGLLASAGAAVAAHNTPGGERFSRFGATLQLANGVIETSDVAMVSTDVELSATGSLRAGVDGRRSRRPRPAVARRCRSRPAPTSIATRRRAAV